MQTITSIIKFFLFLLFLNGVGVLFFKKNKKKEASYLFEVYEEVFDLIGADKYLFAIFPIIFPTKTLRDKMQEFSIINDEISRYLKILNIWRLDFVLSVLLQVAFGFLLEKLSK